MSNEYIMVTWLQDLYGWSWSVWNWTICFSTSFHTSLVLSSCPPRGDWSLLIRKKMRSSWELTCWLLFRLQSFDIIVNCNSEIYFSNSTYFNPFSRLGVGVSWFIFIVLMYIFYEDFPENSMLQAKILNLEMLQIRAYLMIGSWFRALRAMLVY